MHRASIYLLGLCGLLAASGVCAQDLASSCRASSSYDLTVEPAGLVFDRAQPAPRRVEMHDGALRVDGRVVRLGAESQDRLSLFERQLRALLPRVRAVADHGVDLARRALHDEAAGLALGEPARAELERRLQQDAAALKARIARSNSTHDWQGEAADRYAQGLAADLAAPVAQDLAAQALDAAMRGDLEAAARLRDQAADLTGAMRARIEQRMQALAPQVQALCPSIRRLAQLQQGIAIPGEGTLDLLQAP